MPKNRIFLTLFTLLVLAKFSFAQSQAPDPLEVIGAWTLPKGFWSYPSSKHENTNWVSKDKELVSAKLKAVIGL